MNTLFAAGIALLLLIALAFGGGWWWHGDADAARIAAAESATAVCESAATASQTTIGNLTARITDLKRRHEAALANATRALDLRDTEIRRLSQVAIARTVQLRKSSDEDPDCVALSRLAICAAVADRLWPDAPEAAADGDPHGSG